MGTLLLDMCRGDDFGRQVKPFAEIVKTFGGESVVIVLPGELGLEVAAGGQRLTGFDDLRSRLVLLVVKPPRSRRHFDARTKRFLVSISPCLGRLKSFLATSTPSRKRYSWIFLRSAFGISLVRNC